MKTSAIFQLTLKCVFFSIWLSTNLDSLPALAKEPKKDVKPLIVGEKGEKLIKALTTTNQPPKFKKTGEYSKPLFQNNYDWKEYDRAKTAIIDLENNAEEVWPSLVEHMTDKDYCFTACMYDSAKNFSRGDVCYMIVKSWINQGYVGALASDSIYYKVQAPNDMNPSELRDWCRERCERMLLYEIQLEAADWGISEAAKAAHFPKVEKELRASIIQNRITELRKTRKPIRGRFFDHDNLYTYSKEDASRLRKNEK